MHIIHDVQRCIPSYIKSPNLTFVYARTCTYTLIIYHHHPHNTLLWYLYFSIAETNIPSMHMFHYQTWFVHAWTCAYIKLDYHVLTPWFYTIILLQASNVHVLHDAQTCIPTYIKLITNVTSVHARLFLHIDYSLLSTTSSMIIIHVRFTMVEN